LATVEEDAAPRVTGLERRVRLTTPRAEHRLELAMRGAYQTRNLAMAVLAAETLADERGLPVDAPAIERATRWWRWPGRCERVALPGGREVLLDAAHNEEGIEWLRRELDADWAAVERPGSAAPARPWRLLFGALDDKPAQAMLRVIAAGAERVVLVRPPSPRGVDPLELASALEPGRARIASDPSGALDLALADGASRLVVCGSIYLVGEVRRELRRRFGAPEPATAPWPEVAARAPRSGSAA
jgi:dihydrofolate synthase/folylpolyglutamate synthase